MKSSLCPILMLSFVFFVNTIIAQSNTNPCSGLKLPEEIDAELVQLGAISNDKAEWERLLREYFEYIDCLLSNRELEKAEYYLESGEEYTTEALRMLPSIRVLYLAYLGRLEQINNNLEEALALYQEAEKIVDDSGTEINNKDKGLVYKYIGKAYVNKRDYYQGLKYFELGLGVLGEEHKYQVERIALLNLIGKTVCRTIDWADTPKYLQRRKGSLKSCQVGYELEI